MKKVKSMRSMKLMILLGCVSGFAGLMGFDKLVDVRKGLQHQDLRTCLFEIGDEVCCLGDDGEAIISIIEAIDLETCPVTLLYQSGVPYTLTASGRYCLAEDLIADAAAVTINGSGITLDLNSHTIFVNADNVTGIAVYGGSNELPNSD